MSAYGMLIVIPKVLADDPEVDQFAFADRELVRDLQRQNVVAKSEPTWEWLDADLPENAGVAAMMTPEGAPPLSDAWVVRATLEAEPA